MAYNVRSPQQWEIISKQVDFEGKTVLDLGCGKGDILCRAFEVGAVVFGVDKDGKNIEYIEEIHPEISGIMQGDVSYLLSLNLDVGIVAIAICFSVLPYLQNPGAVLKWINDHSVIAFIECQYAGDGPGLAFLIDNEAMKDWLLVAGQFKKVENIGHTLIEGRNKRRYIWMCE